MGIDETLWIDIHGPKDEIDEIEIFFSYIPYHHILRNCDEAKAKAMIKTLNLKSAEPCRAEVELLKGVDFGPLLSDRGKFTRINERYLHIYCSYTYRGSYHNIAENIEKLSKYFPDTLFRYQCEDEDGYIQLIINRHVNGKHIAWSTQWSSWERWHGWSADGIREYNEGRERTTTTVECGCKELSMSCGYTSPIYNCSLQVLGTDKELVDIFEKRGVTIFRNRDGLSMVFQYTKNPIRLMEWLSTKYKECRFLCEYSNPCGTQCVWSDYRAIHYPYVC